MKPNESMERIKLRFDSQCLGQEGKERRIKKKKEDDCNTGARFKKGGFFFLELLKLFSTPRKTASANTEKREERENKNREKRKEVTKVTRMEERE